MPVALWAALAQFVNKAPPNSKHATPHTAAALLEVPKSPPPKAPQVAQAPAPSEHRPRTKQKQQPPHQPSPELQQESQASDATANTTPQKEMQAMVAELASQVETTGELEAQGPELPQQPPPMKCCLHKHPRSRRHRYRPSWRMVESRTGGLILKLGGHRTEPTTVVFRTPFFYGPLNFGLQIGLGCPEPLPQEIRGSWKEPTTVFLGPSFLWAPPQGGFLGAGVGVRRRFQVSFGGSENISAAGC